MVQNTPKRKIKDSVFTNLFQDKKYLLRLYKALESKEQEVVEIMMVLFDDEQALEAQAKDSDDNATHRETRENARIMLKNGRITVEEIPSFFPKLTLADAKELEAEVMQLA